MSTSSRTKVHASRTSRQGERGFSLIELMVALVLGLIVVGGVINIFLSNQQVFRTNQDLGRLQENARTSFELMAREVRQAGGNPCGATLTANVLNNAATAWWANWDAGVLQGFDGAEDATGIVDTGTAATERVAGTDAILILSGGMFNGVTITAHDPGAARLTLNVAAHGFSANDYIVVCDGMSAAITQVTAASAAPTGTVDHAAGPGTAATATAPATPGNCTTGINFPAACPPAAINSRAFQAGGFVTRYSAHAWYVGINPRGGRSLYRISPTQLAPEEIAEGVVDMQVDYLLRNQATGALGNDWVDASTITDWTPAAPSQVVAARLRLQLQTLNNVGADQQPIQRELIHVVNLRNRAS